MPCYKCANGRYKYGKRGKCQFSSKSACEKAQAAIHANKKVKVVASPQTLIK